MQLELSAEDAAFREELRTFFTTEVPQDIRDTADAAARCGLQVSRAARHIGQEAMQLHGGIGMTAEYAVGTATAHLTVLDHLLGDGHHHLGHLADRVTEHQTLEVLG